MSRKLTTSNSVKSKYSVISGESRFSAVLAMKKAEAESAKVGLQYSEREAAIRRKQFEMEEEMKMLKQHKQVAMAETEVQVLEKAEAASGGALPVEVPEKQKSTQEKVAAYVAGLPNLPPVQQNNLSVTNHGNTVTNHDNTVTFRNNTVTNSDNTETIVDTLGQMLMKKELLTARLECFNDKAENYPTWKSTFNSVVAEIKCTDVQQLDLLVRFLGPESKTHASSIRAANQHNPKEAVKRIWQRLHQRYGAPEILEASLKNRLNNFTKITHKDHKRFYDLSDLLSEIESLKSNDTYTSLLSYFDTSSGVNPIVSKLPHAIQNRWTNCAYNFKQTANVPFPPFSAFVQFIRDTCQQLNDPCFQYEHVPQTSSTAPPKPRESHRIIKKTEVTEKGNIKCLLHNANHTLAECQTFQRKPYKERIEILQNNGVCFKCCSSKEHFAKDCKETLLCLKCNSSKHITALHDDNFKRTEQGSKDHSGEETLCKCTQVCHGTFNTFKGKSCAKNLLVKVYPKDNEEQAVQIYATIDDQSNTSLCSPNLLNKFNIHTEKVPYTLSSCAGKMETCGRRASNLIISSLDGRTRFDLPTLVECSEIPNVKEEIPTPDVARHHPHLKDITNFIAPFDDAIDIELLIGRDLIDAHHVIEQKTGPPGSPYAQRLPLGWVIVGEACLGKVHPPDRNYFTTNKLYKLDNGRPTTFKPCKSNITVEDELTTDVFHTSKEDDKPGTSVEDREFLEILNREMHRNEDGSWIAPLPFKPHRQKLPNNKPQATKRSKMLHRSLQKNTEKRSHFFDFMQKIFDNKHAEEAPPLSENEECWYLPIFGVYHPRKPSQIRAVFDSSAQYEGISLNNVLLQGPDLTNDLLGILVRFRTEPVGILADIQQMFHCFQVTESHRNYLRFLWYKDNNFDNELIDYRMKVHVFGNRPSPAVATYGLRRAVREGEEEFGRDTCEFVENDFYVDDAVSSLTTPEQASDLLKRTQKSLLTNGNLRLHKIISNNKDVMKSFPAEDLAKDLKDLNLDFDTFPLQRSLGMLWNVQQDTFTFSFSPDNKPYTKRGILSTINSIYDPLGFIAPVTVQGKLLLRDIVSSGGDWDDIIEPIQQEKWIDWRDSLSDLQYLQLPRMILPHSLKDTGSTDLHIYCDASDSVIAAAAYIKAKESDGGPSCGFILGKAKVAPSHGHTIPRLELCAAVLGTDIAVMVTDYLRFPIESVQYFTDSKIVLGYLSNRTKRFSVYVTNRVERILRLSSSEQWCHVSTRDNSADQATRPVAANEMQSNAWLKGPPVTSQDSKNLEEDPEKNETYPEEVMKTAQDSSLDGQPNILGSNRFEKFSRWDRLVRAMSCLRSFVQRAHPSPTLKTTDESNIHNHTATETFIIKQVQREVYAKEIQCFQNKQPFPKDSPILSLNPTVDMDGIVRVGGRLSRSGLNLNLKHPAIIPGKHHIAVLLIKHHHELVKHQGRHFTEGAIRAAGLWIIGVKRLVASVIHNCVQCKKARGKQECQIMADLPADRLTQSPPFTFVGVDAFGPWEVVSRKTRGGLAHQKRWAIVFSCLVIRAIHIEIIEEMSSSSFVNALRRFISLRGKVQQFRSDRGTNFIGSTSIIGVEAVNVEDDVITDFLDKSRTRWIFNPPHASHMGGSWERMIGTVRRILDRMMAEVSAKSFSHEVLVTFMAEVTAIINSRPIVPVSADPEQPFLLTPATLLTQKTDHAVMPLKDCDLSLKNLYLKQWRQVQVLADMFWGKFKQEYLQTLQQRQKWQQCRPNIKSGDIVLLQEKNVHRNEWPLAIVENAIQSADGKVRKVELKVVRDGKTVVYTRPITEIVHLMSSE